MGLNIKTPDYNNYEAMYKYCDSAQYSYVEIGFRSFCIICNKAGLSFQQFRMVFAALYLAITLNTIQFFTKRRNYVLALFFIWPFIGFVSGMRFAMAAAIACGSVRWLTEGSKRGTAKYIIGIIVAAMFHYSAFFYLVFIFKRRKNTTKKKMLLVGFIILTSALIYSPLPLKIFQEILKNEKLLKWVILTDMAGVVHSNILGFLANSFLVAGTSVLVNWAIRIIQHNKSNALSNIRNVNLKSKASFAKILERQHLRLEVVKRISILSLLIIPGYIITSEYSRVFYGVLLLDYCVFAEAISINGRKITAKSFFFSCVVVAWTCVLLWYYIYSYRSHDVFATLRDNLLFQ